MLSEVGNLMVVVCCRAGAAAVGQPRADTLAGRLDALAGSVRLGGCLFYTGHLLLVGQIRTPFIWKCCGGVYLGLICIKALASIQPG